MSDDDQEGEQEFLGYRLILTIAGPNYSDQVTISSTDVMELLPTFVERNGLTYERYNGESNEEWVEYRFDYIVGRRMEIIEPPPTPPAYQEENDISPAPIYIPPEEGDRS